MTIFSNSKNTAIVLATSALPFLVTSCSKESAPDPARSENKLVFELFNTLKSNDHKATLKKVERLRIITPGSLFLVNLDNVERMNLITTAVNELIAKNNLLEAIEYVTESASLYPGLKELQVIKKELSQLHKIEELIIQTANSKEAADLRQSIILLQKATIGQQDNTYLEQFIKVKQELAGKLTIVENKRLSLFDLMLDIDYAYNNQDENCWNDLAQLALEEPESPVVKHYMGIMQGTIEPGSFILPKE